MVTIISVIFARVYYNYFAHICDPFHFMRSQKGLTNFNSALSFFDELSRRFGMLWFSCNWPSELLISFVSKGWSSGRRWILIFETSFFIDSLLLCQPNAMGMVFNKIEHRILLLKSGSSISRHAYEFHLVFFHASVIAMLVLSTSSARWILGFNREYSKT